MIYVPHCEGDLAGYYAGSWRFTRHTKDNKSDIDATVEGVALFSGTGQALDYSETGTMTCGDYEGTVSQNYIYNFTGPFEASVLFSDQRLFHHLDLKSGQDKVTHWCAPDQYDGRYQLHNQDKWALIWKISGPRKDSIISTTYHRLIS